jgi:hypothetical protein
MIMNDDLWKIQKEVIMTCFNGRSEKLFVESFYFIATIMWAKNHRLPTYRYVSLHFHATRNFTM